MRNLSRNVWFFLIAGVNVASFQIPGKSFTLIARGWGGEKLSFSSYLTVTWLGWCIFASQRKLQSAAHSLPHMQWQLFLTREERVNYLKNIYHQVAGRSTAYGAGCISHLESKLNKFSLQILVHRTSSRKQHISPRKRSISKQIKRQIRRQSSRLDIINLE